VRCSPNGYVDAQHKTHAASSCRVPRSPPQVSSNQHTMAAPPPASAAAHLVSDASGEAHCCDAARLADDDVGGATLPGCHCRLKQVLGHLHAPHSTQQHHTSSHSSGTCPPGARPAACSTDRRLVRLLPCCHMPELLQLAGGCMLVRPTGDGRPQLHAVDSGFLAGTRCWCCLARRRTCVDLPHPVAPLMTTTSLPATASSTC
jgi:hypothetical protein